jgi:hypothetical protein
MEDVTAPRKPAVQQPASGTADKVQTSEFLITYSIRISFGVPIHEGKNDWGMGS